MRPDYPKIAVHTMRPDMIDNLPWVSKRSKLGVKTVQLDSTHTLHESLFAQIHPKFPSLYRQQLACAVRAPSRQTFMDSLYEGTTRVIAESGHSPKTVMLSRDDRNILRTEVNQHGCGGVAVIAGEIFGMQLIWCPLVPAGEAIYYLGNPLFLSTNTYFEHTASEDYSDVLPIDFQRNLSTYLCNRLVQEMKIDSLLGFRFVLYSTLAE